VSEAPGYVENYTHGVDALLVEIGSQEDLTSAIEALLSDEVTRGGLAANASIISQAFTWEKCVALQLDHYINVGAY
jgi:glycosyltransferase involved in cell wall biosynthesis